MAISTIIIMKPADPDAEDFLQKRVISVPEEKREALRTHAAIEHRTAYVWFDDELPPDLFVEIIAKRMEQMN